MGSFLFLKGFIFVFGGMWVVRVWDCESRWICRVGWPFWLADGLGNNERREKRWRER